MTEGNVFYRDVLKQWYPTIDRGEGIYLYDTSGKRYVDACAGAVVVSIGHGVREVVEVMAKQAQKVCYAFIGEFTSPWQEKLASQVIALSPKGFSKVYFVSSGSEATEAAMALARVYHMMMGNQGKYKVISRWQSYHGSTMGALSMSGHTSRRKDYTPYFSNFPHISAPYCYRCDFGLNYPECGVRCAWELERVIKQEGPEYISAFIAEPIIGNAAACVEPPPEYFGIVRSICDRYNVLLIMDEVMTGFGRTGKNFGIDHWNVIPDLIATGKGMTSGYAPLAAVIIHEKINDTFVSSRKSPFLGHTYSGNPLSCAVGSVVLEYIERNGLMKRVSDIEPYLFQAFQRFDDFPIIGEIRGKGLFLGVEFVADKRSKVPFKREKKLVETFFENGFKRGLILLSGTGCADGILGDHVIVAPPFIIDKSGIEEIADLFEETLLSVQKTIGTE